MVKSTGNIPPHRFASAAVARLDRQLAVVIAAVAVGLLARDIPWDLLPGDSGEFQFAAWRLGLAHPTGYPLYLLLGGGWQHFLALFGMAPSGALNLLSALFAGTAAGLFYWLLVQWLPGPASARRLGAGLAVAFLLANPTVRSQAIIAEVYALHLLLLVAILLAAHALLAAGRGGQAADVRPTAPLSPSPGGALPAGRPGAHPPRDDAAAAAAPAALPMAERPHLVATGAGMAVGGAGAGAALLALSLHPLAQRSGGFALAPSAPGRRRAEPLRQHAGRLSWTSSPGARSRSASTPAPRRGRARRLRSCSGCATSNGQGWC